MGIETGQRRGKNPAGGPENPAVFSLILELKGEHIHAVQPSSLHMGPHLGGNRPQILTYYGGVMPPGFQG